MASRNFVVGGFVFLVFCLVGLTSAASSSTEAEFSISGCTFYPEGSGGVGVGVAAGQCLRGGTWDGLFYCDEDETGWLTMEEGLGCAMGDSGYTMGTGMPFCCPSNEGLLCNDTGVANMFQCAQRLVNCGDQNNSNDCIDNDCIWLNEECIDGIGDLGCLDYNNSADCNSDTLNLSSGGIGTEHCGTTMVCEGTTYSIPEDNCGCTWNSAAAECQVKIIISEMFYDNSSNRSVASCSTSYDLGDCTDGEQNVTWFSTNTIISGTVPSSCFAALDCTDGEGVRFCGEPIIKLPGFSLFSFLISLFIIGLYYLLMNKFKYSRGLEGL